MDYRKLNSISKTDPYPLPRIDDLIDNLGKAKLISALDLTKGYWQVPIEEKSREKTAFITPQGKYEMPFGLMGAPSTFQRLMDIVLDGTREFAAAYLDDIIIYSATWNDHLHHLNAIFTRLKNVGLTVKESKCQFAKGTCTYLGHVVGDGIVKPE